MLISYNRPDDITFSLIGTGSAWLSDDAGAALANGRPASVSRIQWLSGTQTTASTLTLRATWGSAFVPRVVALLGLTLPSGTLIKLAFRRPADSGYTYLENTPQQRVVQLPDGSRCVWFVLDAGLDAVVGVEYRVVNNVDGTASIVASSSFDAGEAWAGPAVAIPHTRKWSRGLTDPSIIRRSQGGQVFGVDRRGWRTLSARFAPGAIADVAGGGQDWGRVEAALRGRAICTVIPRWRNETAGYIQRGALLARASDQGPVRHLAGNWYDRDITFEEIPAQAAE